MDTYNPNQLAATIRILQQQISKVSSELSMLKTEGGRSASLPGQYAGKPIPTFIGTEVDIPAATNRIQANIVVAADGPFVARAIHFAWRPTAAGGAQNKWRQISSIDDLPNTAIDLIDFYFEYFVSGAQRNRQDNPVPSALLSNADQGRGFFEFFTEDVFSPTATVTVWITPSVAPVRAGRMYVGFSGAYILE
jgi:hypothetical protein